MYNVPLRLRIRTAGVGTARRFGRRAFVLAGMVGGPYPIRQQSALQVALLRRRLPPHDGSTNHRDAHRVAFRATQAHGPVKLFRPARTTKQLSCANEAIFLGREDCRKPRYDPVAPDQTTGFDHVEHHHCPDLLFHYFARLEVNVHQCQGPGRWVTQEFASGRVVDPAIGGMRRRADQQRSPASKVAQQR
jgi:hypothetical protein